MQIMFVLFLHDKSSCTRVGCLSARENSAPKKNDDKFTDLVPYAQQRGNGTWRKRSHGNHLETDYCCFIRLTSSILNLPFSLHSENLDRRRKRKMSSNNNMRCCIIGGGGYFGQHIAREMQHEGFHTVLLDLSFTDVDREGFKLDEKKTTRIQGSLLDEAVLEKGLKKCSVCFHIAAYGMSGPAALDAKGVFQINVQGTILVLTVCARLHCRRVVFASSVGVIFTDQPLNMADEDTPRHEQYYSYYSESKADAEQFLLKANGQVLNTVALRLRGIFGPGEPRTTTRAAEAIAEGLYFAKFEKTPPVMTQFSGVDNSARAMYLAAKGLFERPEVVGGKVYHIVDGGDPVDTWEFWNPLVDALGRERPSWSIPYKLVHHSVAALEFFYMAYKLIPPSFNRLEINLAAITNTYSIERARKDLGYDPKNNHDLTEVCEYYKKKFAANPPVFRDYKKIIFYTLSIFVAFLVVILSWFIL